MTAINSTCRCGHSRETHEHLRRGSDCGACGSRVCRKFRPARVAGDRTPGLAAADTRTDDDSSKPEQPHTVGGTAAT